MKSKALLILLITTLSLIGLYTAKHSAWLKNQQELNKPIYSVIYEKENESSSAEPVSIFSFLESTKSTEITFNSGENNKNNTDNEIKLTPEQKTIAEKLTSLFENGTTEINYDYAENLKDGRGITAGRAGFTTADEDAYEVVKRYSEKLPYNPLYKYLKTLKKLSEDGSNNTKDLEGFEEAWKNTAKDKIFRDTQDEIVDELYYKPAIKHVNELGLKTPLAQAVIYDTIIQHGDGDYADGLPALIKETTEKMHGTPKNNTINENAWLKAFIQVRKNDLENAKDKNTRDIWKESVGRCDVFLQIAESENYELKLPIKIKTKDYDEVIK